MGAKLRVCVVSAVLLVRSLSVPTVPASLTLHPLIRTSHAPRLPLALETHEAQRVSCKIAPTCFIVRARRLQGSQISSCQLRSRLGLPCLLLRKTPPLSNCLSTVASAQMVR